MARFNFIKNSAECSVEINLRKFLENYFSCNNKEVQQLNDVINLIDAAFPKYVSENEIAAKLGRNEKTVSRIFIYTFGIKYKQLIQTLRIYCALNLMYKSNLDITEISEILNYTELSSMDRDFQKVLGMTPYNTREKLGCTRPEKLFHRYYRFKKIISE